MRGFTLIELIFVILILALMSAVAVYYIPDTTLDNNAKVLKEKILDKRSNSINFISNEGNLTCIEFDIDKLNKDENSSRVKFRFSKRISFNLKGCDNKAGISFENNKTICFDKFGRPFVGEVDDKLKNLCNNNVIISLNYRDKEKNITVYTISGAVR